MTSFVSMPDRKAMRALIAAGVAMLPFAGGAATSAPARERYFGGYRCTGDCSGHRAGYEWAQASRVTKASACSAQSPEPEFAEGCQVYIQEPGRDATKDDDGKEIGGDEQP